jgi:PAS domain S-box-containing protein
LLDVSIESDKDVLFVDDESDAAELAAKKVEQTSKFLSCEATDDLDEARERASDLDCLVCDYRMPEMNGVEFLREIRSDFPNLPFIIYTSLGSEEIASKAIKAGVTDYVRKEPADESFKKLGERIENSVLSGQAEIETAKVQIREMFGKSSDSVYLKDRDGVYQLMNSAGAEKLGMEPREIVGKTASDLFPEEDAEKIAESDQEVLEKGEAVNKEVKRTVNGEEIYFSNTKFPHENEDGEIDGIIGISRDITEKKQKENRIEAIFNNTDSLMAIIDTDRTVLRVNEAAAEFFDRGNDELESLKLGDLERVLPEDRIKEMFSRVLEDNTVKQTVEMENKEGEPRIMKFSLHPVKNNEGDVSSVLAELHDITEMKRNERQLEAAFNSSFQMMGLVDTEGEILRVNSAVADFFGVEKEEVVGREYIELDSYIRNNTLNNAYTKFIKNRYFQKILERDFFRQEVVMEKPDGQNAILDVSLKPVTDEKGEVTAILAEARNITEMKSNERQLKDQKKRLEKFSSIVSHDLRNPLNVASGYIDLAKESGESEDFEKAKNAVKRMEEIIEELLSISGRPEEFEKEDLSLEEVFEKAYSFVDADPEYTLKSDMDFRGSSSGIIRMFQNMIENTVEHNEDASIEVGTLDNGFYYEDGGELQEDIEKITEYGYTSSEKGSGMGLSVVQRVSEINGWDLNVVRNDEEGLRFEFLME